MKKSVIFLAVAVAVALCFVLVMVHPFWETNHGKDWGFAPYLYLDGTYYFASDEDAVVSELPEGFTLLGEAIPAKDDSDPGQLGSNMKGTVYTNPDEPYVAYFQPAPKNKKDVVSGYTRFRAENAPEKPETDTTESSDQPVYVIYEGIMYVNHGSLLYSQPAGVELIGKTVQVDKTHTGQNLESNEEGAVYYHTQNPGRLYFRWNEWDDDANGTPEPWLLCEAEVDYGPVVRMDGCYYARSTDGWRDPTEEELLPPLVATDGREWPSEDGQISGTGFPDTEAIPAAQFGLNLQVFLDGKWVIFEAVNQ